jgi:type II secretory pathway pseudopilin PulG
VAEELKEGKMKRTHGLTLAEVVISLAVVALLAFLLLPALARKRDEVRRLRCRNNLNQMAKGMATYINELGDGRYYPWPGGRKGCGGTGQDASFGGAEWLATLYWTRTRPDPGVFICPSSPDTNANGRDLGLHGCAGPGFRPGPDGKLKPNAVSYAAWGSTSVAVYETVKLGKSGIVSKSAIRDDVPPGEPMGSDDTEGSINHGRAGRGGMSVLFWDSHVEFWTHARVDLETGVGSGDLVHLRN